MRTSGSQTEQFIISRRGPDCQWKAALSRAEFSPGKEQRILQTDKAGVILKDSKKWGYCEMRHNTFISKLIALLYIAGLFFLGVSPPVIAEEKQDGTVAPKPVAEALTEVEQDFEAETVTTGVRELTMVLQPGETAKLKDFDKLEKLDATGSTNYEELRDWGLEHPEVELLLNSPS